MFPEADHVNSLLFELNAGSLVSFPIPLDFRLPELAICPWQMTAPRTSMPKAAIYKDSESPRSKKEIGASGISRRPHRPTPHASPD